MKAELEKKLSEIEEINQKPSELFDDNDTSGNKIYLFQTPSKKNAMAEKALSSRTPTSKQEKTPIKSLRVLVEKSDLPNTPTTSRKKLTPIPESSRTPRNQPRKRLNSNVYFSNNSESESVSEDEEYQPDGDNVDDDDDESEEEVEDHSNDDEEEEKNKSPKKLVKGSQARKTHVPITPCRRSSRNKIIYTDYVGPIVFLIYPPTR